MYQSMMEVTTVTVRKRIHAAISLLLVDQERLRHDIDEDMLVQTLIETASDHNIAKEEFHEIVTALLEEQLPLADETTVENSVHAIMALYHHNDEDAEDPSVDTTAGAIAATHAKDGKLRALALKELCPCVVRCDAAAPVERALELTK